MKHIRSLLLLSMYILTSSASATESLNDHFNSWKTTYLNAMNPQELNVLANILLNLLANAIVEEKMQQLLSPLDHLTQSVRSNVTNQQNPDENITLLKRHLEKLSYVTGTRTIYANTLNVCFNYYNNNRSALIDNSIENLQLYAQSNLYAWARDNAENTHELLATTAKNFTESSQFFSAAALLYKGLSEGRLPTDQPEQYKDLIIVDAILKNNAQLLHTADSITNMINHTANHAKSIIQPGITLYKKHYETVYNIIMSPSFDKQHARTMFSMYGLLPTEYTAQLPHPDHVFEHMLQTTKLYTQTEFIQ